MDRRKEKLLPKIPCQQKKPAEDCILHIKELDPQTRQRHGPIQIGDPDTPGGGKKQGSFEQWKNRGRLKWERKGSMKKGGKGKGGKWRKRGDGGKTERWERGGGDLQKSLDN